MAAGFPSQDAWVLARDRYVEDLSEEEKHIYYQASLETILYDASAAEKTHKAKSRGRNYVADIQPLVDSIDQYGKALDIYSNMYPLVLSPLWGSIRIVLHVRIKQLFIWTMLMELARTRV